MRYDNHLNGCLFFYDGVGKGSLQLRAGNNRMLKLDAKLHQQSDGSWWLAAGRAKDGALKVEAIARLEFAHRGRLKATANLQRHTEDSAEVLGALNFWVAETEDGVPFLQIKPRANTGADRKLPF